MSKVPGGFDGHSVQICRHNSKNTKRRTILVAGGAGFLGSHLCDRLLQDGHEVICVDDFSTGRMDNLWHLLRYDTFSFIRHDVIASLDLPVSEIYNLACPASPPHYQADPIHTMKTCVFGSLNLLELAAHHPSAHLPGLHLGDLWRSPGTSAA